MNNEIFLNIIIFFSPNYEIYDNNKQINKRSHGTVIKKISMINQFVAFYKSIKKYLKSVKYQISIVHSTDFNKHDKNVLNKLDVDLLRVKGGYYDVEWNCAPERYVIKTKIKGTHRLIAETDMLLLKDPDFNWDVDFQFNYAGSNLPKDKINLFCEKYNIKKLNDEIDWNIKDPHDAHHIYKINYKKICPHMNNGLLLIKEEMSHKLYEIISPIIKDYKNIDLDSHYLGQYITGPILLSLSDNWKPFAPGINYLSKPIKRIGKENIQLFHYCGVNGSDIALKEFKEYF